MNDAGGSLARLDWLVFSSLCAAAIAACLTLAVSAATGANAPPAAISLAFAGTLCIYNVDRLRDLERDRGSSPARSAFVERHRRWLVGLAIAGGAGGGVLALGLGREIAALCAAVLAVGLLHRRLKRTAAIKSSYVTLAWLAITVGVPVLAGRAQARGAGWAAAIVGLAIASNLIASNLRDSEALARGRNPLALGAAALTAAGALLLALRAPGDLPWLGLIPLAALTCLPRLGREIRAGNGERYGLVVVDGVLALGALATITALRLAG